MSLWEAPAVDGPWVKLGYTLLPDGLGRSGWDRGAYSGAQLVILSPNAKIRHYFNEREDKLRLFQKQRQI